MMRADLAGEAGRQGRPMMIEFAALGLAAAAFLGGIVFALRDDRTAAAVLIIAGAALTMAAL